MLNRHDVEFTPSDEMFALAIVLVVLVTLFGSCDQNDRNRHEMCMKYSETFEQYRECR